MRIVQILKFDGLEASVSLNVDSAFRFALETVFFRWGFSLLDTDDTNVFADITLEDDEYIVSSPFMARDEGFDDPVNALCRLVVELAWAQLREHPDMLCLHGAAVEINGRLVVFPSTRRAGKSTLCLGFMATDTKVFTDDFLPLQINQDDLLCGMSQGISTRVRLPIPSHISPHTQQFFGHQQYIENRQYRYVTPTLESAASYGETAPLGALVFLEQKDGAAPLLEPMEQSDALTALIRQNFSRAANASTILNVLSQTVQTTPCYRLIFDNIEAAVSLIKAQFHEWPEPLVKLPKLDFSPAPEPETTPLLKNWQKARLLRHPDVSQINIGDKRYLSGQNGRNIIYLNEGAAVIWHLLAEPTTAPEIIELLRAAFPEQDPARIEQDVNVTLQSFVSSRLVVSMDGDGAQISDYTEGGKPLTLSKNLRVHHG